MSYRAAQDVQQPTSLPSAEVLRSELARLTKLLRTAGNAHQLAKIVTTIESKQQQLDEQLARYTSKQTVSHASNVRSLESTRVELSTTLKASRSLSQILTKANDLSNQITEKVRLLDMERSKVHITADYVDNVRILKNEVQKAAASIKQQDWLTACKSISQIRSLPEGLIDGRFVSVVVPTSDIPDSPRKVVGEWITQLNDMFTKEFNTAAQSKDVPKLTYYFQLFPLIGKDNVGIECYSRFVCNIISDQSRIIIRNAQGRDVQTDYYAQLLFQLFQTIADIVHQHSRIIKKFYGSSVITTVLKEIQHECDLQSGLIFDTFWDSKKISKTLDAITRYDYPILVRSMLNNADDYDEEQDDGFLPSLYEVGSLIEEFSTIMNHWSMYCKFFIVTWNEALGSSNSDRPIFPKPLLQSTFMEKTRVSLSSTFDRLCTFAVRRTIEGAYQLEQLPDLTPQLIVAVKFLTSTMRTTATSSSNLASLSPDEPPVSSMIDDITISLNSIMHQTVSTGQQLTLKNMVTNIRRILENDLLNILAKKLRDFQPRANSQLLTPSNLAMLQQQANMSIHGGGAASIYSNFNGSSTTLGSPRSGTPPVHSFVPIGGNPGNINANIAAPSISAANVSGANMAHAGSNMFVRGAASAFNAININAGADESNATRLANFISILNSVSMFGHHLERLVSLLDEKLDRDNLLIMDENEFAQMLKELEEGKTDNFVVSSSVNEAGSSVHEKVKVVIGTLSSNFREKTKSILNGQVNVLFQQVFRNRISKMINDTFKEGEYLISSEDLAYGSVGMNESVAKFLQEWNSLVLPYLATLTRDNFTILIDIVVKDISANIESKIWGMEKKCNELGSSKLERNISLIIGEITKLDYGLRNRFVRVTQIIMLMGLDEEDEVEVFDEMDWVLTPVERSRARNLRVDIKS
ncbi:unnamed protein product [Kuraishia capsulata CBS 1993]|uniref:Conserved oligomeric Golgi complex subunit 4 n=1 Tax=Kuraishia capsulata CBS 1993 TaxID=1382522 RepID=W6MTA4_9ASCO|nr:uncharacterized protein KUCA_T00005626001 [Kuraishia capsulata CBS 1993]CDK29633.1 unnamed protein product [Kuraishia capsulata CBS 1993]